MKVVALLGGLGSQMFKYAFFLCLRQNCQNEKCYISTIPFYMSEMWNGYELNKIFNITAPDFIELLTEKEIDELKDYKYGYRNYMLYKMTELFPKRKCYFVNRGKIVTWKKWQYDNDIISRIRRKIAYILDKEQTIVETYLDTYDENYKSLYGNIVFDEFNHTSDKYISTEEIDFKKIFVFPKFMDTKNIEVMEKMLAVESVAVHIRRSDHLYDNNELFKNSYYIKAVDFIKSKVDNPIFFIFSEDKKWCNDHLSELGIEVSEACIIDWNNNEDSFRDMQLMTYCKHNILAISSFSWWGYYLSNRLDKIVCAPIGYWFEVPIHF